MTDDLLEQLAQAEVPPVPAKLSRDVHDSLNRTLLAAHLIDLAIHGTAYACNAFAKGVLHVITLTITGKLQDKKKTED
ncbi:MAG: hypothetical protein AB7O62_12855 [Pirellulales bacterium]